VPDALTWEPDLSFVKEHDKGKVLINSAATPGVVLDVLILRCDTIKNDPTDVQALGDGILNTVDYTNAQRKPMPIWRRASVDICRTRPILPMPLRE
jgi:hypothetical protein